MTTDEKREMVKAMSGESDDSVVSAYLYLAGQKVIRIACPKGTVDVPEDWDALHVEAAVYLLNKRGGEGQVAHSENGISRSYESADLPPSLLLSYGIVGHCEVIS